MKRLMGGFLALGFLGAVAIVAVTVIWLRDDSPPPVTLDGAIAGITTSTPARNGASTAAPGGQVSQPGSYEGSWQIVADESFVGYRVREELARIGATTAVGRTSDLTGRLEFDGTAITLVEVTVDLTTLQSDDSRRDNQLRRQALETNEFPEGAFVLLESIEIGAVVDEGTSISATATGELTLHGVTRTVEVPLEGRVVGDSVVVVGSLPIAFADYEISPPTAGMVLSVEDHAVVEMQLVFRRA